VILTHCWSRCHVTADHSHIGTPAYSATLRLGPALGSILSYDERMLDAAQGHGVAVAHSGWRPAERTEPAQTPSPLV